MSRPAYVVYYDSDCGICTATVSFLRHCDWLRRFSWTPYQSLDSPPAGLAWQDLEYAIQLTSGPAVIGNGFHAIRKLMIRLPILVPIAALMWLPGAALLGVPAYQWVARNRYRLSSCVRPGTQDHRRTDSTASDRRVQ